MAYKVLTKSYLGGTARRIIHDMILIIIHITCIYYPNLMFYTAHGAYSGSGSSFRNLETVVLVSESTVYTALAVALMQSSCTVHLSAQWPCDRLYSYTRCVTRTPSSSSPHHKWQSSTKNESHLHCSFQDALNMDNECSWHLTFRKYAQVTHESI